MVASLRATLGYRANRVSTPTGLWPRSPPTHATPLGLVGLDSVDQGSSLLATLGFVAESLWDSHDSSPEMWEMMSCRTASTAPTRLRPPVQDCEERAGERGTY